MRIISFKVTIAIKANNVIKAIKVFKAIKTFKAIVAITASSAIIVFTFKPISYHISPALQACFMRKNEWVLDDFLSSKQ